MSLSTANLTPTNFELTPCRVTYKGVDLGGTSGNVVVKIEQALSDIKADQLGSTIIDKRVSGVKYQIDLELDEVLNKDNWKILFPSAQVVTQGPNKMVYFDDQIGFSQRGDAGVLILHPLSKPDADKSEDFYVYLAVGEAKSDWTFSPSEQVKMKLTFYVYPDFSTNPVRYFLFGDPAVGLVAASASSPLAGVGNTGNGTVSGVAVFSGQTTSEIITLSCVTPQTDSGVFYVSGSTSGALGQAQVGVGFACPVIGFTINDGSTDFALNDSFTIQTVAANYG